jgi:hypothetical protein
MTSRSERSIPELFSDAFSQLAKLIGNEFALARAEVSEKAARASRAAGLIGAGAVLLIPGLTLLLFAAAAGLIRSGFSEPVAYLVAGGGGVVLAMLLIATGLTRLSGDTLKLNATLDEVQRDQAAAREMIR